MNFHHFDLWSTFQGFLTKKKTEDGYILGVIYPSKHKICEGDALVHQEHFQVHENEVTLLTVDKIEEERPAKGTYKSEGLRPTFRKIKAVRTKFFVRDLCEHGIVRVEQVYDPNKKKEVDVVRLNIGNHAA